MAIDLPNGWEPRHYQLPVWSYLEGGGKRADVVAHRRWGKDDVGLHWAAVSAHQRVGTYWHLLPEASQARKAIWDAVNPHTGKRRIDEAFPRELRETTRENDMMIRFKIGSTWQVVGSDNYNSLVGSPPIGVVLSEWSLSQPNAWNYLRPILAENGGWAMFIWTPRNRNHATRAFEAREQDPNWFTLRSPATKTGVYTDEQLATERAELIRECGSEDEGGAMFRQEYLVDFDAAVLGSYFGPQLAKAQEEGRIGRFPYDPMLKVRTAWDIGVHDYTAIWFMQENGHQVRAIDYYETSGQGPDTIVPEALSELIPDPIKRAAALESLRRPIPFAYDMHYLPHDIMVREWGGGAKARLQTLTELGVRPIKVGVQTDPADRINAARRLLPVVSFDAERCAVGLDHLRNYRKRWNASLNTFTGELHDKHSHGADAFGEYAVNCRIVPARPPKPADRPHDGYRPREREEGSWKTA